MSFQWLKSTPILAAALMLMFVPNVQAAEKESIPKPALLTTPAYLENLRKDIDYLAGEECEGRGLKTKGIVKAGEYIADTFKNAGLKPAGTNGSWFQPFTVYGRSTIETPVSLNLIHGEKSTEIKYKSEFVPLQASSNSKKTADLVFVGYGLSTPKYDEYAGVDVKGKIVVVIRRTPQYGKKDSPFNEEQASLMDKIDTAVDKKAAGILFISDRGLAEKNDPLMEAARTSGSEIDGPAYHIKRNLIDNILKQLKKPSLNEIEESIDKDLKPKSFALTGWSAETVTTVKKVIYPTRNVVGVLEGNGSLADETIVIGAHYDHLGRGDEGSSLDRTPQGKVHYGADDNGSGTTGLLELARRFGAMKNREGRRIVFIAFSGEEKGLDGSKFYCRHPSFPLEKTTFMINMDMIGRMKEVEDKDTPGVWKDRLLVYGTGTADGIDQRVTDTNKDFNFKLNRIPGGRGPSDHMSFYNKQIPVLFLFTGTHKDYHRPSDTPDKINLVGLFRVVDFAEIFAKHYSTNTDKLVYRDIPGGSEDPSDPTPRVSGSMSIPRLGFTPGNYGEENAGVLVEAVNPGEAADKGGIKAGDFIVEIAGKPVKNMTGYMTVLRGLKGGQEVEIVVMRKDKKTPLKVVLGEPKK